MLPCDPPPTSVISFLCGTALLSLHICNEARFIKEGTRRLPTLCYFISGVWFPSGLRQAENSHALQNRLFHRVHVAICGEKREPIIVVSWPCWSQLKRPLPEGVELGCGGGGGGKGGGRVGVVLPLRPRLPDQMYTHTLAGHFPLCCCAPQSACDRFQIECCVRQAAPSRWFLQSLHDNQNHRMWQWWANFDW